MKEQSLNEKNEGDLSTSSKTIGHKKPLPKLKKRSSSKSSKPQTRPIESMQESENQPTFSANENHAETAETITPNVDLESNDTRFLRAKNVQKSYGKSIFFKNFFEVFSKKIQISTVTRKLTIDRRQRKLRVWMKKLRILNRTVQQTKRKK